MKRKLLLTAIFIITAASLFAGMSYIGVNAGYAFTTDSFIRELENSSELKTPNKSQSVPILLDGGSFFSTGRFDIGVNYGATLLSFRMPEGGSPSFNVSPYIGLSLKYNFGETFFISGTAGAEYRNISGVIQNEPASASNISVLLDFNGGVQLFSLLMMKAGFRAGIPVYTLENSSEVRISGYSLLPYAGIAIIY